MASSLKNEVVLITGASSGIGKSAAFAFARAGARLILVARREKSLRELSKTLQRKFKTSSLVIALDIRNRAAVERAIDRLSGSWGAISILLNSAGLSMGFGKIQETDPKDWDVTIDTNLKGLLYVTHAVLSGMIQRKKGHIINLGSIAGHEVYTNGNVYCATKFAVRGLNRAMQVDLVETPIRVSSIDPGLVETEFSEVRFGGDKKRAKKVYEGIRPLTAEDVADAILFVATRPAHVNIHNLILFPVHQASASVIYRKGEAE